MSTFSQVFNPISGQMEWEVRSQNYDFYQEVARSDYGDMLHDTERNQKYYKALKDTIARVHSRGQKANVLDIGTGTGLLSMMAVASGADTVVACEAFKPMADCAEKIIARNGMSDRIKLIKLRSTEMKIGQEMDARANILVTEVFDTELIGEGAIDVFRHAHENLLEAGATVIPHFARIYAQIVESPLVASFNKPKLLADLDGEVLIKTPCEIVNCPGSTSLHEIQLNQLPTESFRCLTSPQVIFSFDFSGKTILENDRRQVVEMKALEGGVAQAVFMWWDLDMDSEGGNLLSCAPFWAHPDFEALKGEASSRKPLANVIPWRDHWMQALYYLPKDPVTLSRDQQFSLIAYHDALSLWFDISTEIPEERILSPPFCTCGFHVACSRSRIGQLNDHQRNKKYMRMFEGIPKSATVLAIGDGSLLGLATAKLADKVFYLNFNYFSEKITKLYIQANRLANVTVVKNVEDIEENLKDLTHVVAEPHFNTSILPWDNLFFFKFLRTRLPGVPAEAVISPIKCDISAIPVEFLDLHKIRKPLRNVEGFNVEDFDVMLEKASALADSKFEAHPLWEYPCLALAEPMNAFSIDLDNFQSASNTFSAKSSFKCSGTCNAVAFWVVWHLDRSGHERAQVSTGPKSPPEPGKFVKWDPFTKQGVFFVVEPIAVAEGVEYSLEVTFNTTAGPVDCKLLKNP
ncbi:Protein arginine N-methyltransferase [Sergentomyia squamirostris]